MSKPRTNGAPRAAALPPAQAAGEGAAKPRGNLSTYRIEVTGKPSFTDAAGEALAAQLPLIGVQSATGVRAGTLYEITGKLSYAQAVAAASGLLADPITQQYHVQAEANGRPALPRDAGAPASPAGESRWRIEIWLRPTVSDPSEASVRKAMADLGLPEPESARCGSVYFVSGRVTQSQAERIALKLLANPVVHRWSVGGTHVP